MGTDGPSVAADSDPADAADPPVDSLRIAAESEPAPCIAADSELLGSSAAGLLASSAPVGFSVVGLLVAALFVASLFVVARLVVRLAVVALSAMRYLLFGAAEPEPEIAAERSGKPTTYP
jgi:hypothetical protein